MLSGTAEGDTDGRRARIRAETRRWHPDKWPENLFVVNDLQRVMDRVKLIAQMLNDLKDQKRPATSLPSP
jgi:hypothetical protein